MTYNPTNWKAGDTVTSAKLNKMEQGIANGGGLMVVHANEGTLDKTWQEIYNAMPNVIISDGYEGVKFSTIPFVVMQGTIICINPAEAANGTFVTITFHADTSNSYPRISDSEEETIPTAPPSMS